MYVKYFLVFVFPLVSFVFVFRPNLSGGGDYPIPWKHNTKQPVSKSFPSQQNPRIIFISSRVPAADVSSYLIIQFCHKASFKVNIEKLFVTTQN